jgi:hypothetical protein
MPARLAACFVRGELHRAGNSIPPDLMRKRRRPRRPVAAAGPTRATTVNAAVIAGLSLSLMRTAGVFDILSAGELRMTEAASHPGLPGGCNCGEATNHSRICQ